MNLERIETVLFNCRRALKLLHPIMNPDEPCVVYEAYIEAGELLIELEKFAQESINSKKEKIFGLLTEFRYKDD